MAEKKAEKYFYEYLAGPAGDGAAADCADCGGTGKIQLLVTTRTCETCGGTGKADVVSCGARDGWGESDYWFSDQGREEET